MSHCLDCQCYTPFDTNVCGDCDRVRLVREIARLRDALELAKLERDEARDAAISAQKMITDIATSLGLTVGHLTTVCAVLGVKLEVS